MLTLHYIALYFCFYNFTFVWLRHWAKFNSLNWKCLLNEIMSKREFWLHFPSLSTSSIGSCLKASHPPWHILCQQKFFISAFCPVPPSNGSSSPPLLHLSPPVGLWMKTMALPLTSSVTLCKISSPLWDSIFWSVKKELVALTSYTSGTIRIM